MPFLTEPAPTRDETQDVLPGISRIVANNPGPMTYHGTNTYLIDTPLGTVVLDPGPEDHPEHVEAIVRQTGGKIAAIFISHTHHDHVGAVPALQAATGAPTVGYRKSALAAFDPDIKLEHGDSHAGLTAVHTPGHCSDHICYAYTAPNGEKVLFSADHVMSWSTSIISPPGGDMRDYFTSLDLLLGRDDDVYLPAHGPKLYEPRKLVGEIKTQRRMREAAVAERLTDTPQTVEAVTDAVYKGIDARLRRAAERNVLAHLLKLEADGRAVSQDGQWRQS